LMFGRHVQTVGIGNNAEGLGGESVKILIHVQSPRAKMPCS
jgi:hypothetical protein